MLKYLNDRVDERVAAVAEGCTALATVLPSVRGETPRNLMGFDMPADLVASDIIARDRTNTLAKIKHYRDDAAKLGGTLRGLGIEPMAIITAKAFDKIVSELGMFTLRPSQTGKVSIDRTAILALKGKDGPTQGWAMVFALVATLAAYVTGFYQWGWNVATGDAGAGFGALALAVVLGFAALGIASVLTDRFTARNFARRAQAWVSGQSWEQLLVALSYRDRDVPTRCFYGPDQFNDGYDAFQREIVLPPAPREVIDIICRIAKWKADKEQGGLSLCIAAEAGAISFRNGLTGLFDLHAINALLAAEEAARRDPILYVRGSCCVAIIAQYGDLPLERQMIDRIVNSEHLL